MKLTNKTLQVLKNFASINNGLMIKQGSKQRTVSLTRDILAEVELDQEFPVEFAIYDLNGFLALLSTFDESGDADIDFKKTHLIISSGKRKLKYFYASPEVIFSPPDGLELDSCDENFTLALDDLKIIQKMFNFGMTMLSIKSDGSTIKIRATNPENPSSTEFDVDIDQALPVCDASFDISLMKVIQDEYNVGINENSIHMKNKAGDLNYWIVLKD